MTNATKVVVSYAGEVIADNSGKYVGNALRFASYEEALQYVNDLSWRWTAVREVRVVTSDEPVNYTLHNNVLTPLKGGA